MDRAGARISRLRALGRTAVKLIPLEIAHLSLMLPTPIWDAADSDLRPGLIVANVLILVYLAPLLFTAGRRTIHDFVAGTRDEVRAKAAVVPLRP